MYIAPPLSDHHCGAMVNDIECKLAKQLVLNTVYLTKTKNHATHGLKPSIVYFIAHRLMNSN